MPHSGPADWRKRSSSRKVPASGFIPYVATRVYNFKEDLFLRALRLCSIDGSALRISDESWSLAVLGKPRRRCEWPVSQDTADAMRQYHQAAHRPLRRSLGAGRGQVDRCRDAAPVLRGAGPERAVQGARGFGPFGRRVGNLSADFEITGGFASG